MSWIESASAHIPAIRLIVLRSAFAPLSVGTPTCAATSAGRPAEHSQEVSGINWEQGNERWPYS